MSKRFKQVSTGLTLVCKREDVIAQYEKYPEQYIPLDKKGSGAAKTAPKTDEEIDESQDAPKASEKK